MKCVPSQRMSRQFLRHAAPEAGGLARTVLLCPRRSSGTSEAVMWEFDVHRNTADHVGDETSAQVKKSRSSSVLRR